MWSSYTVALFGHLVGVLVFFSGVVLAGAPFELARRRDRPAEIAALLSLARIGALAAVGGAIVTLAFGLWLVDAAGYDFGTGWISAALGLYVVALVLGAAGGQGPKRARLHATGLGDAPADPQLRRLLDDPRSRLVNYASALVLLAILVLMVFKP
jgi:uncharacterized membrane protein